MHMGGRLGTHPNKEINTSELKYVSIEFWKELKTPWIESISNNKELKRQPEKGALGKSEYPTPHFWEVYFISARTQLRWMMQMTHYHRFCCSVLVPK